MKIQILKLKHIYNNSNYKLININKIEIKNME